MGTEMVMVDEIPFSPLITTSKPLPLLGYGITDIEIHFLQIKFTAIGVYLDTKVADYLQPWNGKSGKQLEDDDQFFDTLISAPVDKAVRVVVIKEIKGSQYGVQLESAIRDRLVDVDKYEEEEEAALEEILNFFRSKYFKKDSVITFTFPSGASTAQIGSATEAGKEEMILKVENKNVVEMIQKWYMGGSGSLSPTMVASLVDGLAKLLSHETTVSS